MKITVADAEAKEVDEEQKEDNIWLACWVLFVYVAQLLLL